MKFNTGNAFSTRAQEQTDFGFTESVDRLHRITNSKYRASVVRQPAGRQPRHQFELTDRRVLEFVDQQVMNAVIQRQRQVSRGFFRAQRQQRALRNLGEIHLAMRLKHQFQLTDGQLQQAQDGAQHLPLTVAVLRRGKPAHVRERHAHVCTGIKHGKQIQRTRLPRLCRGTRRESLIFG